MAVLLLCLLVAVMRRAKPPSGTLPTDKPVVRDMPSSEEATPDASDMASPRQVDNARKRTPPA